MIAYESIYTLIQLSVAKHIHWISVYKSGNISTGKGINGINKSVKYTDAAEGTDLSRVWASKECPEGINNGTDITSHVRGSRKSSGMSRESAKWIVMVY